jgi:hypothetical protein
LIVICENGVVRNIYVITGNSRTLYGRFDVLVGKGVSKNEVGAKVVLPIHQEDSDLEDENDSSNEDLSQIKVKSDDLQFHLSQIVAQTIVFSFHQRKHYPLYLLPSIGVSKHAIQFHFYDAREDLYFASYNLPLFYTTNELNMTVVLATWLVLNHSFFTPKPSKSMLEEGKFGFHSLAQENLFRYRNEICMGSASIKPHTFQIPDNVALVRYEETGITADVILEECKKRKKDTFC